MKISRNLAAIAALFAVAASFSPSAFAQGCVPARFISLSLGPDGISLLRPGQWQLATSYRFLFAEDGWRGTDRWPEYETIVGNQITIHSLDVQATYAFTSRFSTTLTVPYLHGRTSNYPEHDGTRHAVNASGIGDVRLVASTWLLDPEKISRGNISFGLGLKAPTGQHDARDIFHKPTGPELRPVDIAIQPGDGGWGAIVEVGGFYRFSPWLIGYANGYYLINPREQNSAYTPVPIYGQVRNLSVPDNYLARAGATWAVSPRHGLSVHLGGRINGVPARDVVGGNEGFRRPGYVIYAEPGLTWNSRAYAVSVFVPYRLDANRTNNVYDDRNNGIGGGAFAKFLLVTSVSRTF